MEAVVVGENGLSQIFELESAPVELLSELKEQRLTDEIFQDFIRNLDISADAKLLLESMSNAVVTIGGQVVRLGKKILEIVFMVADSYPKTMFGLILGVIVTALVVSIPLIGGLLASFLGPVAIVFGLVSGYSLDIRDSGLKNSIQEIIEMFSPLKGSFCETV